MVCIVQTVCSAYSGVIVVGGVFRMRSMHSMQLDVRIAGVVCIVCTVCIVCS